MKTLSCKPLHPFDPAFSPSLNGDDAVVEKLLHLVSDKDRQLHKQSSVIDEQSGIIEQKSVVIAEQKKRIALLEEYVRLNKVRLYGRSSEKDSTQGELFDEAELEETVAESPVAEPIQRKPQQGRKPLSSSLPRHQVTLI